MISNIKGYDNYYITKKGIVYNIKTKKELKESDNTNGYKKVTLYNKEGRKQLYIHRLVASVYIPNPSGKYTVNHIDGNKSNNDVSNLEWATQSENNTHAIDSGLNGSRGETHNMAKLTSKQVSEIKQLLSEGVVQRRIAEQYGVSPATICHIKSGKKWGHTK